MPRHAAVALIEIDWHVLTIEGRQFCNAVMREPSGLLIGDPDALTVKELMQSSIQDMLTSLGKQLSIASSLEGTSEAVFRTLRELRESTPAMEASFYAVPRAVECFDGEVAYLIRQGDGARRFIWQDFTTKKKGARTER
jgi:hypothetical protein